MEYLEPRVFFRKAIFDAGLFCKIFYFQSASSPKGAGNFSKIEPNPLD
jgi:hypothetical protein